jgi:hypothetical protein
MNDLTEYDRELARLKADPVARKEFLDGLKAKADHIESITDIKRRVERWKALCSIARDKVSNNRLSP